MAPAENLVEALKFLADQQGAHQGWLAQMEQQQANMMAGQQPKDKSWSDKLNDIGLYKNIRVFAGDSHEWEKCAEKFKSQVASGNVLTASVLDFAEATMAEADLEEDDFATMIAVDGCARTRCRISGANYTICC